MAEFDLQTFLQDMDRRIEDRHNRLEQKIDDTLTTVADHETRVAIIEQTPPGEHEERLIKVEGFIKNARWFIGTTIAGGVAWLFTTLSTFFSSGSPK